MYKLAGIDADEPVYNLSSTGDSNICSEAKSANENELP